MCINIQIYRYHINIHMCVGSQICLWGHVHGFAQVLSQSHKHTYVCSCSFPLRGSGNNSSRSLDASDPLHPGLPWPSPYCTIPCRSLPLFSFLDAVQMPLSRLASS